MRSARHWDARLHSLVGGLPDSPADRWLRRLTTAAFVASGALIRIWTRPVVSTRGYSAPSTLVSAGVNVSGC